MELENMNLRLYTPNKDLCDTCLTHQTKNLSDEEFNLHQQKKENARNEKQKDKENEPYIFTMDLQRFKHVIQKLAVHNFAI